MTKTPDQLKAEWEAARERANRERTPEARDAAKAAWSAADAAAPKQKISNYVSRAGKRQAAERNAMHRRR